MRRAAGTALRLFLLVPILWLAGFVWFMMSLPGPQPLERKTDGIVVLTGGSGRLARGIEALRAGSAERLLVSGVDPSVRASELAGEVGAPQALFDCCIDLGRFAEDTRGNGAEVANWAGQAGYASLRVVTASDHMRRALAEIRPRLPANIILVPDAVPASGNPRSFAVEYSKLLARVVQRTIGAS